MEKIKNVRSKKLRNDLSGKRFGMLDVLSYAYHDSNDKVWYNCKCDCGNIVEVKAIAMTSDGKESCGCTKHKDRVNPKLEVGKTYNEWSILKYDGKDERFVHRVTAKCMRCGTVKSYVNMMNIVKGLSKNCGCARLDKAGDNKKLDLIGSTIGYLTVESFIGINSSKKRVYRCKCVCGNYISAITQELRSGKASCGCKGSTGEAHIALYLEDNNIEFIREFRIQIKGRTHIFDFYLPKYNMMIEFDGGQHYYQIDMMNIGIDEQRISDLDKDLYCITNNLRLLRIPYYHLGNVSTILDYALFKYPTNLSLNNK